MFRLIKVQTITNQLTQHRVSNVFLPWPVAVWVISTVNHQENMIPTISENHTETSVNVRGIVERVLRYQKPETLNDLNEILILDKSEPDIGFGCYRKAEGKIEIYLDNLLKWQPWILKKSYLFPYMTIAMALCHELDNHVTRDNSRIDREKSAENSVIKYLYPSLGVFKPAVGILRLFGKKKDGMVNQ
ncbi:MAG: hypothetical protein ABIK92_11315 [Pseudomonadota bacterium]